MRTPGLGSIRSYFKIVLAAVLILTQVTHAASKLDVYFNTKAESLSPEHLRAWTASYNGADFDPEKSSHWPKNSIQDAYDWVLEKIPEAQDLPAQELKDYFKIQLLILKLSQNGYINVAESEIPRLTRAILDLNTSVGKLSDISNERKTQIMGQLIQTNLQWGFVTLGHLTLAEKKRIQWTLGLIVKNWTEGNELKTFTRKANTENYGTRGARAVVAGVVIGLSMIGIAALGDYYKYYVISRTLQDIATFSGFTFGFLASLFIDTIPKRLSTKHARVKAVTNEFLKDVLDPENKIPNLFNDKYFDSRTDGVDRLSVERRNAESNMQRPLSADELRNLLLDKIPVISGAHHFFRTSDANPDILKAHNAIIENDPELKKMAEEGRKKRQWYENSLSQVFSDANSSWVQDPEKEILNQLLVITGQEQKTVTRDIQIRKAQALALNETQIQFGLSPTTTLDDIERGRFTDTHLANAYEYFRRRFFQLQSREESFKENNRQTVEEFKKSVKDKIQELRLLNATSAMRLALTDRKQTFYFSPIDGGKKLKVKLEDLEKAQIIFDGNVDQLTHEYAGEGWIKKFGTGMYEKWVLPFQTSRRFKDEYHFKRLKLQASPTSTVKIKLAIGDITLTETDFNILLFNLNRPYEVNKPNMLLANRFLLEASRREAQLSDALKVLYEKNDTQLEGLTSRLKIQIADRFPLDHLELSITERIKYEGLGNRTREQNLVEDIKWAGLLVHHDYWRARDGIATSKGVLTTQSLLQSTQESNVDELTPKRQKKEIEAKLEPELDGELFKTRKSFFKAVAVYGTFLVMAPHIVLAYSNYLEPLIPDFSSMTFDSPFKGGTGPTKIYSLPKWLEDLLPDFSSDSRAFKSTSKNKPESKKQEERPIPKDDKDKKSQDQQKKEDPAKQRSEDKSKDDDTLRMDESFRALNHEQNQSAEQQEAEKNKVYFEIRPRNISLDEVPTYMNLMAQKNYPKSAKEALETKQLFSNEYDFSVTANYFQIADKGILPIVTPSGYRAVYVSLEQKTVTEEATIIGSYFKDFKLMVTRHTGFNYVDFGDKDNNKMYRYTAYYKKITEGDQTGASFEALDPAVLKNLTPNIRIMGATQLATAVDLAAIGKKEISLNDFATIYSSTGVYTYDKELQGLDVAGKYSDYKKFLRDGVLYYQCTGSNRFMADILTDYYKIKSTTIQVSNVIGFVRKGEKVTGDSGHMHTLIADTTKDFTYYELDGTPKKMDPKYENKRQQSPLTTLDKEKKKKDTEAKKLELEKKKKEQEERRQSERYFYGMRANEINIKGLKRFPTPYTPKEKTKEELETEEKKKQLENNVAALEARRSNYLGMLHKYAENDESFRAVKNKSTLRGLRILQIVPIILDVAIGKTNLQSALLFLTALDAQVDLDQLQKPQTREIVQKLLDEKIAANGQDEIKTLKSFLNDFKNEFDKFIQKEKGVLHSGQKSKYAYLMNPALQAEIMKSYELLETKDWVPESSSHANSCKSLLN